MMIMKIGFDNRGNFDFDVLDWIVVRRQVLEWLEIYFVIFIVPNRNIVFFNESIFFDFIARAKTGDVSFSESRRFNQR